MPNFIWSAARKVRFMMYFGTRCCGIGLAYAAEAAAKGLYT